MPAAITRGKTFSSTETVTNTKLHQLVDDATISNIDASNFDATTRPCTAGTSAPSSPVSGEIWYDTTNLICKQYNGTNWVGIAPFTPVRLQNKSGGTLAVGDVVILDSSNASAVTTTTTIGSTSTPMTCLEALAADATGLFGNCGHIASLAVADATAIGDYLKTSGTAKKATSQATFDAGSFAQALTSTAGAGTVAAIAFGGAQASGDVRINSVTYTGNGTSQSVTGMNFQPDMLIIVNYANPGNFDMVVRTPAFTGTTSRVIGSASAFLPSGGINSLDSDGFSVGNAVQVNQSAENYEAIGIKFGS